MPSGTYDLGKIYQRLTELRQERLGQARARGDSTAPEKFRSDQSLSLAATGSKETMRGIKDGHDPGLGKIVKLAQALNVSVGFILGETDDRSQPIEEMIGPRQIPLRLNIDQLSESGPDVPPIYPREKVSDEAFAFLVNDASMAPTYRPGDIVIADPHVEPEPGELVVAFAGKEQKLVLRQYQRRHDHSTGKDFIALKAFNPSYAEIQISDRVPGKIEGKVVETILSHRARAFG